ncbi:hypothetical protein [Photobacterium minamisatsumaniensis]
MYESDKYVGSTRLPYLELDNGELADKGALFFNKKFLDDIQNMECS